MNQNEYFTRGDIATLANVSVSKVEYVLNSRHIVPAFRAAGTRVYDRHQTEQILEELKIAGSRPASGRTTRAAIQTSEK